MTEVKTEAGTEVEAEIGLEVQAKREKGVKKF